MNAQSSLAQAVPSSTSLKPSRSTLVSRNVTVSGHRTSVRLEPDMWNGLMEICRRERATPHEVCSAIAGYKSENTSLTAAIRVFVMKYYRSAATEEGHTKVGHGHGIALGMPNTLAQIQTPVKSNGTTTTMTPSPYIMGASRANEIKGRVW